MRSALILVLNIGFGFYLPSVVAIHINGRNNDKICTQGIYGELAPYLSDFPPAEEFCSSVFPVSCTTARKHAKRASPQSSTTISPPKTTKVATTSEDARHSAWSKAQSQALGIISTLCSCIGTPRPCSSITTTSPKTTTSSKPFTITNPTTTTMTTTTSKTTTTTSASTTPTKPTTTTTTTTSSSSSTTATTTTTNSAHPSPTQCNALQSVGCPGTCLCGAAADGSGTVYCYTDVFCNLPCTSDLDCPTASAGERCLREDTGVCEAILGIDTDGMMFCADVGSCSSPTPTNGSQG